MAQTAATEDTPKIALTVPSGAPLRVYLTKRISKRAGAPVEAKTMEPVYAFDREVVPAGTTVEGRVSSVQPVSKWERARAIVGGDFTPLRSARLEFTTLVFPDAHRLSIHTVEAVSLNSIFVEPAKRKKPPKQKQAQTQPQAQNGGLLGTAKQTAKDRINAAINSRTHGIADVVRSPNKKEKLIDMFWAKLPYHPQYLRRGTRIDAPLGDPLNFGFAPLVAADLAAVGSQPAPDSIARVRLLTALDSATARQGDAVEAVTTAPLFSADHKLVMPEGTRLTGAVTVVKKARSFHRGGQLRFNFQSIDLPPELANLRLAAPHAEAMKTEPLKTEPLKPEPLKTQAVLAGAEGSGKAAIKVDSEGGVKAQEPKTRFVAPIVSLMLASRAADNDAGHHHATGATGGGDGNVSGRTLGGGLGLGMMGAAISQSSPYVGMAFGYYGLAWSVYSNVLARGGDVQFDKNAMMDLKFGARVPPEAAKFRAAAQSPAR